MRYPKEPQATGPVGHHGEPGYIGTPGIGVPFSIASNSVLKFLVKFNAVSKNLETPVENAMNAVEKIMLRFPGAEIDVDMDVKIL